MAVGLSRTTELVRKSRKLVRLLGKPAYRRPLRFGVAASVEHESVPFGDYRTVIDVGAGRGQFALFALRAFPAARIVSFEPLPSSFATASRAVGGSARVQLRRQAVGAAPATAEIHVTADADSSSLRRPTGEQTRRFPGTGDVDCVEVEVVTLDGVLSESPRPVLLKLDLQGGELDALRGAENLLAATDAVFVECSFVELYEGQPLADQVICHLRERGFTLGGVYSPHYGEDGVCVQADLLFGRSGPR
jgi:FkbM family methyltransferase